MINHSPAQLIAELRRLMDMDYELLPGARHVLEEAIAVIRPWRRYDPEAPPRARAIFWTVPNDGFLDGSGKPIVSTHSGLHIGMSRSWSSLQRATHWMPLPDSPEDYQ